MSKQPLPSNKWVSNLTDPVQIKEFQQRLLENKDLFQRLFELIEAEHKENRRTRISKDSYEKPAWAEYQADSNGFERALSKVQDYLKFTQE